MELMQASFDGGFPDSPLPNLGSGLFRIHVDATCLPASGGALWVLPQSRDGILRDSFVLACFASASPEALVLRTASLATSCFPALDVRKARPEGSSADGR